MPGIEIARALEGHQHNRAAQSLGLSCFPTFSLLPRLRQKIYPRRDIPQLSSLHLVPEGQPSGGMPLAGRGRRLRVGLRPTPGRLRGTALGVLRPLCEELAGRDATRYGFRERGED